MQVLINSWSIRKTIFLVLVIVPVLVSEMCLSQTITHKEELETDAGLKNVVHLKDGTAISIELSRTDEDRSRGLTYREEINENEGMLFIFDTDGYHKFWMKNMKFSIDILWLDSEFTVVHTERDVLPCTIEPCPLYAPSKPARYVLEVKANMSDRRGIEAGDILNVNVRS